MVIWIVLLGIVGLVLAFAEMLMPGFGIFGVLGSICLLATLFLVGKFYGLAMFVVAVLLMVLVFALMLVVAKKSGFYEKVVLRDKQEAKDFDESTLEGLLHQTGMTQTTLRPYGVAEFDGKRIDVSSNGDFIDRGEMVRIVEIHGKSVLVEKCN